MFVFKATVFVISLERAKVYQIRDQFVIVVIDNNFISHHTPYR